MVRRRLDHRNKKPEALDVDAVVASAAEAVRRAWEEDDDTP
jgi:hypothetical protein